MRKRGRGRETPLGQHIRTSARINVKPKAVQLPYLIQELLSMAAMEDQRVGEICTLVGPNMRGSGTAGDEAAA